MSTTIAVIGEVVADAVLPPDGVVNGVAHLAVHPGGGPANTAVALARLGTTARFAGRLSGGALGALCRAKLEASGVDLTTSVVVDNPATLAIARLDADGAASYEFYTEGTNSPMTPPVGQHAIGTAVLPTDVDPPKAQPDPVVLRKMYVENRCTVGEIAVALSISRAQVTATLKAAGVQWRSPRKQCPVDQDCLRSMVADGVASPSMLARRYGVARNTAARWLAEAGLLDQDPVIDERQLRELYVGQRLTTREVAAALGVNKTRILLALAAAGIAARPREMKRPRAHTTHITADAAPAIDS